MPTLSVAENVFMGFHPVTKWGLRWVNRKEMNARAAEIFKGLEINMDVRQPAANLSIAQQQLVEIAKALIHEVKVLILDEPTATLSAHETAVLFRIVRRLESEGAAVLFVSHRLEEVFELASEVTVMRDGEKVGTFPCSQLDADRLVTLMVGRNVDLSAGNHEQVDGRAPILEVKGLTQEPWYRDVSFAVRPGEIVGVAGLVGAGRTNVAETLFGISQPERGEIRIRGEATRISSVRSAIRNRIVYVPEDRHKHGAALPMDIAMNISLPGLSRISKFGIINRKKERKLASDMIDELNVRTSSSYQKISELSGGNQQKAVFAKWTSLDPEIVVLDEPTRGVDVGAKGEIYRIVRGLAEKGAAIIVISSDLPEILTLSDRVLVMREGAVVGEIPHNEMSEESIMSYATGVKKTVS